MSNDKCKRDAVYGVLMAVMTCLLIVVFAIAVVDYDALEKYGAYKIIKDNGSLIGGVLAIIGVFLMISHQNKITRDTLEKQDETTKMMIESSMAEIKITEFSENKSKALMSVFSIEVLFDRYFRGAVPFDLRGSQYIHGGSRSPSSGFTRDEDMSMYVSLRENCLFIKYFFGNENSSVETYIDVLESFFAFSMDTRTYSNGSIRCSMAYDYLYRCTEKSIESMEKNSYFENMFLMKGPEGLNDIPTYKNLWKVWVSYEEFIRGSIIPMIHREIKSAKIV